MTVYSTLLYVQVEWTTDESVTGVTKQGCVCVSVCVCVCVCVWVDCSLGIKLVKVSTS